MYSIRERLRADRQHQALTGMGAVVLMGLFLACLVLPWTLLRVSNLLTILAAAAAMALWHQFGLPPTGGPITVVSRVLVMGMNGLLILAAAARMLGFLGE